LLDKYTDEERVFLTVRPGITGYSQAYFRNDADGKQKIVNDVYYAKHCTLWMDIKVFFKTIVVVLKKENTFKDTKEEVDANKQVEALKEAEKEVK